MGRFIVGFSGLDILLCQTNSSDCSLKPGFTFSKCQAISQTTATSILIADLINVVGSVLAVDVDTSNLSLKPTIFSLCVWLRW